MNTLALQSIGVVALILGIGALLIAIADGLERIARWRRMWRDATQRVLRDPCGCIWDREARRYLLLCSWHRKAAEHTALSSHKRISLGESQCHT